MAFKLSLDNTVKALAGMLLKIIITIRTKLNNLNFLLICNLLWYFVVLYHIRLL